jgi:hypothetical protein
MGESEAELKEIAKKRNKSKNKIEIEIEMKCPQSSKTKIF